MESTGYEFSVLFINLYLYSLCRYIRMGIESLVGDTYNTQFKRRISIMAYVISDECVSCAEHALRPVQLVLSLLSNASLA